VWSSVKLEAWVVGFTAGSREVPGRKDLWQETSISYDDDDDGDGYDDDDDDNNNNNNNNNNNLLHKIQRIVCA
jgi:hypothetical protein